LGFHGVFCRAWLSDSIVGWESHRHGGKSEDGEELHFGEEEILRMVFEAKANKLKNLLKRTVELYCAKDIGLL
jgi:hypothetical protein